MFGRRWWNHSLLFALTVSVLASGCSAPSATNLLPTPEVSNAAPPAQPATPPAPPPPPPPPVDPLPPGHVKTCIPQPQSSAPSGAQDYLVYSRGRIGDQEMLDAFRFEERSEKLSHLPGFPTAWRNGWRPMVASDRFIFALTYDFSAESNTIISFRIDRSTGKIEEAQKFASAGVIFSAAEASTDGRCLFAYGENKAADYTESDQIDGKLYSFEIGSDGSLNLVGDPLKVAWTAVGTAGESVMDLRIGTDGGTLYSLIAGGGPHATSWQSIRAYRFHTLSQSLSEGPKIAEENCYACDEGDPYMRSFTVTPDSRFVIAAVESRGLRVLNINEASPKEVTGSPFAFDVDSFEPLSPSPDRLYVVGRNSSSGVFGFNIHQDGTLLPLKDGSSLSTASTIIFTDSDKYMLGTSGERLLLYSITEDGTLKPHSSVDGGIPLGALHLVRAD